MFDQAITIGRLVGEKEKLETKVARLEAERLSDLRRFLSDQHPIINGPGWLSRVIERASISDFLNRFEAAEAARKEE